MADIRRRVVEEGFYGKTVFDVVHDRQNQNTFWGPQREKSPCNNPWKIRTREKPVRPGNGRHHEGFLRKDQGRDDDDQDMGQGRGMER